MRWKAGNKAKGPIQCHQACWSEKSAVLYTVQVVVSLAAGMPQEVASTADDEGMIQPPPSSVEDVVFFPTLPLALTASLSGAVGVWDIATQKLRHTLRHQVQHFLWSIYTVEDNVLVQAGVVRLQCSRRDPLVFTGCLDGGVRVWDVRGGECVREWWGHTKDLLDLTIARYVCTPLMCPAMA